MDTLQTVFDLDQYNLRKACRDHDRHAISRASSFNQTLGSTELRRNSVGCLLAAAAFTQEADARLAPSPFEPQLHDVYVRRISNIGLLEIRVRPSATLPSSNRRIPLRPCVPITTKSAGHRVASSSMTS